MFDLAIAGSLGLGMISVAFALSMLSFEMAITSLIWTSLQLNTFVNLFGIVFAGVGGALVPLVVFFPNGSRQRHHTSALTGPWTVFSR